MIDDAILGWFRGRNVLVTGGTGMVGRQVVALLCDAGACVRIASLDQLEVDRRAEHALGDLTDVAFCHEATRDMEVVFHLAGIKGSVEVTTQKPASFFVPLLLMNTNVMEASRVAGVRRLVYTSSIGAYPSREVFREEDAWDGPPMDRFPGWAKRMGELQVEAYRDEFGLDTFAVVRLANVYGPGDNFDPASAMVIPALMSRVKRGEDPLVVWGDGSAVRDFVYSRDVAEGVVLALYHGTGARPMNLGSGVGCSVAQLVETLSDVVPFRYEFDASRPAGFPMRVMDVSLARERLGYAPATSLREGLGTTWDWYVAHEREFERRKDYFAEARHAGRREEGGRGCFSPDRHQPTALVR